ncbi:response regulator [Puniceicoccus vermicola]|uniref:Response regulator n=1 Tax=Puniceicoccus vermicola TaxID=388746 RepID=A0A7X1B0F4_9BACT|nr:hypothetical protein [Puniceicoccus vermicola]MBC2603338.1 hypothetical protein [Puniceicoccus vermicola]
MKNENKPTSAFTPKFLVIDDDLIVGKVVQRHIQSQFSHAIVDTCSDPVVHPGYDVYFVDNNFNGQEMALNLLRQIRALEPQALVVALSNTLDLDLVSNLVNNGCNVIYDKGDISGSHEARKVITNYLAVCEDYYNNPGKRSARSLLSSIKQLLNEWNHRLAQNASSIK